MTIPTINLSSLKKAKNSVIGNPTAKLALAHDDAFIEMLVECINNPSPEAHEAQADIRTEAAHVIASLAYGSSDALRTLLRCNAHQAFLYAISLFRPTEPPKLKAAFARALRVLASTIAEEVGPSQWGLRTSSEIRVEAKAALDYLFQTDILDIYLPLLADPWTQTSMNIAQLLAAGVRTDAHRTAVTNWLLPSERLKEIKGKRGWEKPDVARVPSRQGGWVVRALVALLGRKDAKLQEAVLYAIACLAEENASVAISLAIPSLENEAPLCVVLSLCKSRSTEIRLAACLCATRIVRAGLAHSPLSTTDDSPVLTVMYVVNRLIASESDAAQTRMKACYILSGLVCDNKELCTLAAQRKSLDKLAALITSITPSEKTAEWEQDEPESVSRLREAALIAVASISMFDDDIRSQVTDKLQLVPAIQTSLSHTHVGVRYAACQCVRAISRSVAVLRTNIVDSGLGMAAYQLFLKQDEDRRITFVASTVVCNLVNESSPLRDVLVTQGLLPRLVQLVHSGDPALRQNGLWAIKNLLYRCPQAIKRQVMDALGWDELPHLLMDPELDIQEQAWNILRNVADKQDDVAMVFERLGADRLLDILADAMESDFEDVIHEAVCALANLAHSTTHQDLILSHPRILPALHKCLVDGTARIRQPAVSCIEELVKGNPRSRQALHDVGIDRTLRHMSVSSSPTRTNSMGLHGGLENDVRSHARDALYGLEHNADIDI